jgi:hypothetical protein
MTSRQINEIEHSKTAADCMDQRILLQNVPAATEIFVYHSAKKEKYGNLLFLILLFFFCVSASNAKTLDLM